MEGRNLTVPGTNMEGRNLTVPGTNMEGRNLTVPGINMARGVRKMEKSVKKKYGITEYFRQTRTQ